VLAHEGAESPHDIIDRRYNVNDRPPGPSMLLYGFQHVLIMFSNVIVTPLVPGQMLVPSPTLRRRDSAGWGYGDRSRSVCHELCAGQVDRRAIGEQHVLIAGMASLFIDILEGMLMQSLEVRQFQIAWGRHPQQSR